jgi:XTP/dITP diphosphohydrolase
MEILVATGNAHKLGELSPLFPGHTLKTPDSVGIEGFEVVEDGSSFLDNALIKARALYSMTGRPCLADDSGLTVRALDGAPGIYSARYGSEGGAKLDARERNALLLRNTEAFSDRACAFVCCLVLILSESRLFVVQESCEGELLRAPRGEGGFGYDPLVYLPALGKSVAELSPEDKNRVSHRGRAAARMARLIEGL